MSDILDLVGNLLDLVCGGLGRVSNLLNGIRDFLDGMVGGAFGSLLDSALCLLDSLLGGTLGLLDGALRLLDSLLGGTLRLLDSALNSLMSGALGNLDSFLYDGHFYSCDRINCSDCVLSASLFYSILTRWGIICPRWIPFMFGCIRI
jgi:hypothetical protein